MEKTEGDLKGGPGDLPHEQGREHEGAIPVNILKKQDL